MGIKVGRLETSILITVERTVKKHIRRCLRFVSLGKNVGKVIMMVKDLKAIIVYINEFIFHMARFPLFSQRIISRIISPPIINCPKSWWRLLIVIGECGAELFLCSYSCPVISLDIFRSTYSARLCRLIIE